jgi:DNA invertase Pin-like site-specific DNA recombinase
MNTGTKLLGYARVSTADQAVEGYGLAAQKAAIRDACGARGWILIDVVADEGVSARTLDRPELRAVLDPLPPVMRTGWWLRSSTA